MTVKRLVVGLTGSFGSGKSTVGKLLKQMGAKKVIDADRIAHEALKPKSRLAKKVRTFFKIKGRMTREKIAQVVFKDRKKLGQLESIVHPYVRKRMEQEVKKVRSGVVVLEVPLLFETGMEDMCDATIAVIAGTSNIVKRLSKEGLNPVQIKARLRRQFPEAEKKRRADYYIKNMGSKKVLVKKTKLMWRKLASMVNKNN